VPTIADTLTEPPCAVCGRRDWHSTDPDKPWKLGDGPPYLAAIAFVCNHCGYLRFHTPRLFREAES
jgi:hypothetical protein